MDAQVEAITLTRVKRGGKVLPEGARLSLTLAEIAANPLAYAAVKAVEEAKQEEARAEEAANTARLEARRRQKREHVARMDAVADAAASAVVVQAEMAQQRAAAMAPRPAEPAPKVQRRG